MTGNRNKNRSPVDVKKRICRIIFQIIILAFITMTYCKKNEPGILGIEVPVGEGKVTDTTPYVVTGVYMDSPAYKEGIRPDDVIIQINDTVLQKGMKFDYIYGKLLLGKPGEKVTLTIKRKDKQMIFQIIRGSRS